MGIVACISTETGQEQRTEQNKSSPNKLYSNPGIASFVKETGWLNPQCLLHIK